MIYGTRTVIEAIHAGKEIEKIMIQSGLANDLIKELIATARERQVPYTFVPAQKLKRMTSKNHQGVVCLLSSVTYASLDNVIDRAYSEGREPFLLILDRITDVRNFGAIARTAECAGVDGIFTSSSASRNKLSDTPSSSDPMIRATGPVRVALKISRLAFSVHAMTLMPFSRNVCKVFLRSFSLHTAT